MTNHILYTHGDGLIVFLHLRSGMIAKAERALVACATPDEMRTDFPTRFTPARLHFGGPHCERFPSGWAILAPSVEEQRWRDAVIELLNEFAELSMEDRQHTDLETAWTTGKAPVVEPYETEADFWARLHRKG